MRPLLAELTLDALSALAFQAAPTALVLCSIPDAAIHLWNTAAARLVSALTTGPTHLHAWLRFEQDLRWEPTDAPLAAHILCPDKPARAVEVGIAIRDNPRMALLHLRPLEPHELLARERSHMDRLLLASLEDFVGIVDIHGKSLFISPSYFRATGYTLGEVEGKNFRVRIHASDLALVERTRAANLRGERTRIEYRCLRKDGSVLWLDLRATPLLGEDGAVEKILWSSRDINTRKTLEAELLDSRRFIEQVADAMPHMLFVFDLRDLQYVYVNAGCLPVRGRTSGELLDMKSGENLADIHPEDRKTTGEVIAELWHLNESVHESTYRLRHKTLGYRWVRTRSLVFKRDSEGKPLQILGVTELLPEPPASVSRPSGVTAST